jgi:hypothetical protein
MLRQMAELPRMEAMVRTPSLLSYYIASNMPLQDATRQELLEVDGTVYRLRREIELLESMDQLRCKRCLVGQQPLMYCMLYSGLLVVRMLRNNCVYSLLLPSIINCSGFSKNCSNIQEFYNILYSSIALDSITPYDYLFILKR